MIDGKTRPTVDITVEPSQANKKGSAISRGKLRRIATQVLTDLLQAILNVFSGNTGNQKEKKRIHGY